jgi:hypothetical protein
MLTYLPTESIKAWRAGWPSWSLISRYGRDQNADEACGSLVPDPIVIADAAYALAELGEDIGAMIALIDRSLALNPSYACGWFLSGAIR